MFLGCTGLGAAPELPAMELKSNCYEEMFSGCTSLTYASDLLIDSIKYRSCRLMYRDCTSLVTPPSLSANVFYESECYAYMFSGCTSLAYSPELPAPASYVRGCFAGMFNNTNVIPDTTNIDFSSSSDINTGVCYGLFEGTKVTDNNLLSILPVENGTYVLPVTTLTTRSCYYAMFKNCILLVTAPNLPATTLVASCYNEMFRNCSKLNYIKAMFTTTPGSGYTRDWVDGVASSGTYVKNSSATYTTRGTSAIPSGWTVTTASS